MFVLLMLACGIEEPVAEVDFIRLVKTRRDPTTFLMEKINEPEWLITYSYSNCRGEGEQSGARLTQGITAALQAWLQPVRDYKPDNDFVSSFRYVKTDEREDDDTEEEDLTISFACANSYSWFWFEIPPRISIEGGGTRLTHEVMLPLMHELGHAFGLEDTYTPSGKDSSQGLKKAVRMQPSSIMTTNYRSAAVEKFEHEDFIFSDADLDELDKYLSDDDKYGVEWLYRYYHEGINSRNCYHSQYKRDPKGGCVPKFPIIFEIEQGQEKWAIAMLQNDKNIDVNQQDGKKRTALHHAVAKGYLDLTKELLAHAKIDINQQDNKKRTALHDAVAKGSLDLTKELLAHAKIKENIQDNSGNTPLHIAVKSGHTKIVEFLMAEKRRKRFKINQRNKSGFTPLHFAAHFGHLAITHALLKHPDIDVRITDNWDLTARQRAAHREHNDVADLLYLFELVTLQSVKH